MNTSVLTWLEATVARVPDKVVFTDEAGGLTFSQVDCLRKAVGSYLTRLVKPGSPVAIMSGRSVLTPVCFLGVASAGCFYAPMDATMPVSRLQQILGVIQASVMLVDRANLELAQSLGYQGTIVVAEDILETEIDERALQSAQYNLTEEAPLYVIFTSGSTGVPKGVITSHHSLMCYIDAVCKVLNVEQDDVFGNQSPLDYIAAVRDIYIPVKTGASTVIIPKNEFSMPQKLFETLNAHKVTALCWSVSGVELPAKLGAFDLVKPEYLKKLCFSGSVINSKYLKIWMDNLPGVLFVNQYGPTEATASCTYHVVTEQVDETTVLPIGRPYENYRILLLKEDMTEAGPGETGEICVSGPILALGYYGAPEKTAEAFIQNPLNPNYRELIYRTGDLGSFREDGVLMFHGRLDRQIKHMGHRIELEEIEETARQISGVGECCALYHKPKEHLYLFYTGDATSKEIVIHFRKVLPAFMAPRKLINLPELPRLPNGKIDMQTLKSYFV